MSNYDISLSSSRKKVYKEEINDTKNTDEGWTCDIQEQEQTELAASWSPIIK